MKRVSLAIGFALAAVVLLVWPQPQEAHAVKEFMEQFQARYVDQNSRDPTRQQFARRYTAARCNVCHVPDQKKDVRNSFGQLLDDYLDKDIHKQDQARIQQVLRYAETQPSNPTDPQSETFGDRIRRGALP